MGSSLLGVLLLGGLWIAPGWAQDRLRPSEQLGTTVQRADCLRVREALERLEARLGLEATRPLREAAERTRPECFRREGSPQ